MWLVNHAHNKFQLIHNEKVVVIVVVVSFVWLAFDVLLLDWPHCK